MRISDDSGPEYGVDWIIEEILSKELSAIDLEEYFEDFVRQIYAEETKVAWMRFDTVRLMKEMDPVSWSCALNDWQSQEEDEGNIISFDNGNTYYSSADLQDLVSREKAHE